MAFCSCPVFVKGLKQIAFIYFAVGRETKRRQKPGARLRQRQCAKHLVPAEICTPCFVNFVR